jgi:DNA-binding NtrC family response regulator
VLENGQPYQVIHRHFDHHHDPDYVAIHGTPLVGADGKVRYMGECVTSISHDHDLQFDTGKMVAGCCPSFMGVLDNLVSVAATDAPVLILGETGTGKELAARLIQRKSSRALGEFIPLDCTLFTEEMFASELFGHAKGAFTGAVEAKKGLYEAADGGTLFLDEVGDMPLAIQSKFLRAIENGTFRRVGETQLRKANVRIICATNRDLKTMVDAGQFRADLYYRINCMQVELPPLRHRREDIPELVRHFLGQEGKHHTCISPPALEALCKYDFPGNVRDLRNILERATILAKGGQVEMTHLPKEVIDPQLAPAAHPVHDERDFFTLPPGRRSLSADDIAQALERHHGNRRQAALSLGISERTLYRKLRPPEG